MMLITSVVLMSMSSSYDDDVDGKAGHNGSPGEQTCAKSNCHDAFTVNSGIGSVSISAPAMTNWQYVPGQSYTINVTVAHTNKPLFGFGFEALLSSGANAGTLTAGTGSQALNATVSGNSRRTITHLEDSGLTNNSKTWSFTWVAPANGASVIFYAAGNAANDSGTDSGDYIYTTSQMVTAVVVPNAPSITNAGSSLLCNGATTTLTVTAQTGVTFTWYDAADNQVGTGTSYVASQTGCYHVIASGSGGTANSTNTICVTASVVNADFSGLANEYCSDDESVVLNPILNGGTFSGPGVSGSAFAPSVAGHGSHQVSYTVTNVDGCTATITKNVTVNEALSSAFSLSQNTICQGNMSVDLLPVDGGGTFTGTGVIGNQFIASVDPGVYEISYSNGTGSCVQTEIMEVTVLENPNASFTGLPEEICSNVPAFPLEPTSSGGFFSGNGISTVVFDPSLAAIGENIITYQITGGNGCTALTSQSVLVNEAVDPSFTLANAEVCEQGDVVALLPIETGGVFSGVGVEGNVFDPAVDAGDYVITHSIGLGSCETSTQMTILVLEAPDASFSGLDFGYCSNAAPVELIPLNAGGTFAGTGVTDLTFDPSVPLPGTVTVSYSLSAENGCSSSSSFDVVILASANSSFSGLPENMCINDSSVVLISESDGGVFNGNGMGGNEFSPASAGAGVHVIEYAIDLVGCSSSTLDTVTVHATPELSVTGLEPEYCEDDAIAVLVPSQSGAVITGDGINDGMFDPAIAGVGTHDVSCVYTDLFGCTANWMSETMVHPTPSSAVTLDGNTLSAEQTNANYAWIDCSTNQTIQNATGSSFTPNVNGNYAVQVTLNGCYATSDCVEVIVISVDEFQNGEILVYPNPAVHELKVKTVMPSQINIYSFEGKLVYQQQTGAGFHTIDLTGYNPGIYDVLVTDAQGSTHKKIYFGNRD